MTTFRLRDADTTLRLFLTAFLLVLTSGYAVGLIFVHRTTASHPAGIEAQFLGTAENEGDTEIRYEKSAGEMFVFLHNHILSLSFMFLAVGGIFFFTSLVSPALKRALMVEPFAAIVTTFGGIALVRYVSPAFSWLVLVSGVLLFLSYAVMLTLILTELWWSGRSRFATPAAKEYLELSGDEGVPTWKNRSSHHPPNNKSMTP